MFTETEYLVVPCGVLQVSVVFALLPPGSAPPPNPDAEPGPVLRRSSRRIQAMACPSAVAGSVGVPVAAGGFQPGP
ncbi:hypothetical protein [Catenulispora pinisilvae]|uniref:hypothetical protein n=1 Tax=Catenulispora pinisilvae TaxID=2705253 RepID=UPI0018912F2B|nr:hypothetical protein [Catenulispora pinisilvae]